MSHSREPPDEEEVRLTGEDARPPRFALRQAEEVAADSGCRVSRRGVSVYRAQDLDGGRELATATDAEGCNGPPWRWRGDDPVRQGACDASESCQRDCGRRCVHAEVRAVMAATATAQGLSYPSDLRLVHVKIGPDGRAVPSGGPRCVPCATFLLDHGVGGIWLYEREDVWRYYPMEEFYAATASTCQLYVDVIPDAIP